MPELVLLGGGGHARSLLSALRLTDVRLLGYVAPEPSHRLDDLRYLGTDAELDNLDSALVELVNAVGSVGSTAHRRRVHDLAVARGFRLAEVRHPASFIDPSATLGGAVQVLAGAVINGRARIGDGSIINSGAIIEHDARVGEHVHVSPGAVLAGDVEIGYGVHIGLGSRILQGVKVGSGSVVGAGAVVLADVAKNSTVVGVPARALGERKVAR